jgi:hypothetical protein
VCLIAACGGAASSTTAPSNVSTTPTTPAISDDGPADCESSIEDAKPGNHDRYGFEAPDGSHGYKDGKGAVVIAPRLRFGYELKSGGIAAAVDSDGSLVYIDTSRRVIARAYAFDNGPDYFQEGHARVSDARKKIGFINDRGEVTIAPRFDEAESFCGGKAHVREGTRRFYIDKRGRETTPP